MCLSRITRELKAPQCKVVRAYKYFDEDSGSNLRFPYRYLNRSNHVGQDTWLRAVPAKVWRVGDYSGSDTSMYIAGFHAFSAKMTLDDVGYGYTSAVMLKVYLYGVRIKGDQSGHATLVADWLYVPSDPAAPAPAPPILESKSKGRTKSASSKSTAKANQL